MHRKKRKLVLPEEVLAVLRDSPNLIPCRKFRKAEVDKFVEHLNEGKCEQCLAFFRMLDEEQQMMQLLRDAEWI